MKKNQVQIGKIYRAKVSGKSATVGIVSESPYGGWNAINVETQRAIRIRTAARLTEPRGAALREGDRTMSTKTTTTTKKAAKAATIDITQELDAQVAKMAKGPKSATATAEATVGLARETKKSSTKAAKAPKAPKASKAEADLVTFAFRLPKSESEEIHRAAGPGKASRFVRTLALAAARNDEAAVKAIMKALRADA